MIEFMIDANPLPWERARSKGARRYNPAKMVAYQQLVAMRYREAAGPGKPTTQPVRVLIAAIRKTRVRCDIDNIAKSILDALNGIAYEDDAQVVELQITKTYGPAGMALVRIGPANLQPLETAAVTEHWQREDPA